MRPNLGLQYDLLAVEQPHRVAAFLELQAPGRADGNGQAVAEDICVEIRPSSDVELMGVINDYPTSDLDADNRGAGVRVHMGAAGPGQQLRLVFELRIPYLATLGPRRVADLTLSYTPVADDPERREVAIHVDVNGDAGAMGHDVVGEGGQATDTETHDTGGFTP